MSKGPGIIERKILLYINLASNGCNISDCEYLDTCHFHREPKERDIYVSELCYYIAGLTRCPADEIRFDAEKYSASIYKGVLRALKSLERKGYIKGHKETTVLKTSNMAPWNMYYKLIKC